MSAKQHWNPCSEPPTDSVNYINENCWAIFHQISHFMKQNCLNKILEKYNNKVVVGILRESFLAMYLLLLALLSAARYRTVLYFTCYNTANSPIHTFLTIYQMVMNLLIDFFKPQKVLAPIFESPFFICSSRCFLHNHSWKSLSFSFKN